MTKSVPFASEAEMIQCWLDQWGKHDRERWTVYPETADWDLLLVHRDGYQLGLEAKLSLNAKVIDQALAGAHSYWQEEGPDYRGVLVPAGACQHHIGRIATAIGIGIIRVRPSRRGVLYGTDLPDEDNGGIFAGWPNWCPARRCTLPDYVPDVTAGHKSPVKLSHWKIKAIKLMILLERRGVVTRADMKALQISPTRWTDCWRGFLTPHPQGNGYVRCGRTPDFKAQHPENWAQIEADFQQWCPPGYRFEEAAA